VEPVENPVNRAIESKTKKNRDPFLWTGWKTAAPLTYKTEEKPAAHQPASWGAREEKREAHHNSLRPISQTNLSSFD
jgi:hypothetical protein